MLVSSTGAAFILFDPNLAPESTLKMGERGLVELVIDICIMVLIISSTSFNLLETVVWHGYLKICTPKHLQACTNKFQAFTNRSNFS